MIENREFKHIDECTKLLKMHKVLYDIGAVSMRLLTKLMNKA